MDWKSKLFFWWLFVFACQMPLWAQRFTAQVSKNKVAVGEVFQVNFSANAEITQFVPPRMNDFSIYSGPNQSSSVQIINNSVTQSISLSYLISAKKEGKFSIGPAVAIFGNKKVESNVITVEVVKGNPQQQRNNPPPAQDPFDPFAPMEEQAIPEENDNHSTGISREEVFVKTSASKSTCYLGEQIRVVQKVYSRHAIVDVLGGKQVIYPGFWCKELEKPRTLEKENVNGVMYYTYTYSTVYAVPQRAGKLNLDPVELELVLRRPARGQPRDVFEQFFGRGFEDVKAKVKGKALGIEVLPHPEKEKPSSFYGAVGQFSVKVELDKDKVRVNEGVNLKITVSGNGNISLVDAPPIAFPEGLETYEPKINENIRLEANGIAGSKTFEYLLIPRHEGDFNLPDAGFAYFDPQKKQYIPVPAPELRIHADPADPNAPNQAVVFSGSRKVQEKENDIRYIRTGDLHLQKSIVPFFGSEWFYLCSVGLLALFATLIVWRKRYLKENADVRQVKMKNAGKMALKIVKSAEKSMLEGKAAEFYTEMLLALNGYVGGKLSISAADLNRETIERSLLSKSCSEEMIRSFLLLLEELEFAKYAPGSNGQNLKETFQKGIDIITALENEIKS